MRVYPDWTVVGSEASLKKFTDSFVSVLPERWSEVPNPHHGAREFQREAQGDLPAVRLIFSSHEGYRSVANIVPRDHSHGRLSITEYDRILSDFTEVAISLADAHGLTIERRSSNAHIRRWLSPEAENRLRAFSENANKSTGAGHPSDRERWLDFVIQAHRDGCTLDATILERLLIDDLSWAGWEDEATSLAIQYEFGRELLNRFES